MHLKKQKNAHAYFIKNKLQSFRVSFISKH